MDHDLRTTTSELAIKGGNHGQHMVYDLRGDNQGMLDHDLRGDNQRRQSCTANDFTNIYADVSYSVSYSQIFMPMFRILFRILLDIGIDINKHTC